MSNRGPVFTKDLALAKAFTRLETIIVRPDPVYGANYFFHDVEHLSGLKCLSTSGLDGRELKLSIPYPIGLESLTLKGEWSDAQLSPLFSSFKQLTHLTLGRIRCGSSLTVLTGLKRLEVGRIYHDPAIDWNDILACMPQLESLHLKSLNEAQISSSCLAGLKKLASLNLNTANLDGRFFSTVGQLSGLTQLKLIDCGGIDCCLWEVNRLTNLRSLTIYAPSSLNPCSYIEHGSLLRLRELYAIPFAPPASVEELFERLPSLRRVKRDMHS